MATMSNEPVVAAEGHTPELKFEEGVAPGWRSFRTGRPGGRPRGLRPSASFRSAYGVALAPFHAHSRQWPRVPNRAHLPRHAFRPL